ncbi:alkylhydroperoxidase domain protein [uncultured Amnibacterium sp.]|uniref:alkylhydroperoxidase domain protein n=1 Tax=uncultured Amnibacterium sp. TaxID=1631851 RepID=UPI0035CC135B
MSDQVTRHTFESPNAFTQAEIGWEAWLAPLPIDELTERHYAGLVDKGRANSPYFRLLVRDPEILGARTRTDNDIFYNEKGGLPRAERELSAASASRTNGCIFCASVHSRFASHYSKRRDDVQRLLDDGTSAVQQDPRWRAVIDASVALTRTPSEFGAEQVRQLREAGLDDLAIADAIHGAAFFNWANRLMLSLGEPTPPAAS